MIFNDHGIAHEHPEVSPGIPLQTTVGYFRGKVECSASRQGLDIGHSAQLLGRRIEFPDEREPDGDNDLATYTHFVIEWQFVAIEVVQILKSQVRTGVEEVRVKAYQRRWNRLLASDNTLGNLVTPGHQQLHLGLFSSTQKKSKDYPSNFVVKM